MKANKKRPDSIAVDNDQGQLLVAWKDGSTSIHSLTELRRGCPCALCRQLRDEPGVQEQQQAAPGELGLINDVAATATDQVERWEPVGRYGIRIVWRDGHDTGIFTFAALRDWDSGTN